jgi:hypothetical protein
LHGDGIILGWGGEDGVGEIVIASTHLPGTSRIARAWEKLRNVTIRAFARGASRLGTPADEGTDRGQDDRGRGGGEMTDDAEDYAGIAREAQRTSDGRDGEQSEEWALLGCSRDRRDPGHARAGQTGRGWTWEQLCQLRGARKKQEAGMERAAGLMAVRGWGWRAGSSDHTRRLWELAVHKRRREGFQAQDHNWWWVCRRGKWSETCRDKRERAGKQERAKSEQTQQSGGGRVRPVISDDKMQPDHYFGLKERWDQCSYKK